MAAEIRLVASRSVNEGGLPSSERRRSRRSKLLVVTVGAGVAALGLAAMGVQAVRGNEVVSRQLDRGTVHDASVDDAYYRCIGVQARSLVSPRVPVTLADNDLGDFVTLLKGVGGWARIADPPSSALARLTLRPAVDGHPGCLGQDVVASFRGAGGRPVVRVGTGASVPGHGPPPAPPL